MPEVLVLFLSKEIFNENRGALSKALYCSKPNSLSELFVHLVGINDNGINVLVDKYVLCLIGGKCVKVKWFRGEINSSVG